MYDLELGDLGKSIPFATPVPSSVKEGVGKMISKGPISP